MDIDRSRLEPYYQRRQALETELAAVGKTSDSSQVERLSREYAAVTDIIKQAEALEKIETSIRQAQQAAADSSDPELQRLAVEEAADLKTKRAGLETMLRELLQPPDPQDLKDIIVEIRAGAGGDEAALFAAELFRLYSRYAEERGWKTNLLSASHTGIGGLKEVIFEVTGRSVYRSLKFESGVHRVQRVPATEKNGRVHTSTVTVAVVPKAEEQDLVIDPKDLKIVTSTSSGHGGQSVNTTYSAIRLTHLPTGLTVSMQDERSQTQNRLKAMDVLRSRLLANQEAERRQRESALRKSQIGSGDRSEKIRTYNFPQDRVTDHRVKMTLHHLPTVLDGHIQPLIDALQQAALTSAQ